MSIFKNDSCIFNEFSLLLSLCDCMYQLIGRNIKILNLKSQPNASPHPLLFPASPTPSPLVSDRMTRGTQDIVTGISLKLLPMEETSFTSSFPYSKNAPSSALLWFHTIFKRG